MNEGTMFRFLKLEIIYGHDIKMVNKVLARITKPKYLALSNLVF